MYIVNIKVVSSHLIIIHTMVYYKNKSNVDAFEQNFSLSSSFNNCDLCIKLNQGACSKVFAHQKSQSVGEMIAVTLKHAPDRAKTANQASAL